MIHFLPITEYLVSVPFNAGEGVIQQVKGRTHLHPQRDRSVR